jgi:transglutaminase-like putative cysteine protease
MVSVGAVMAQGALDPATAAGSLVAIPAGSWLSYRRRRERNVGLKAVLGAALIAALAGFLSRVRYATSVDEARVALGSLFVWVQVIHSFDVPRRRDLAFSVVAGVALMAEAASLSLDERFGLFLVPFICLTAAWLYLSDRVRARAEAAPATIVRQRATGSGVGGGIRAGALWLAVVTVCTAAVFLATPRFAGTRVLAPPFSLTNRVAVPGFSGGVVNPDLPGGGGGGGPGIARGLGYPGFGAAVDLRVRGRLSDRVVMRVRSPQPALWRGQAYDTFDGTTWTESVHDTVGVTTQGSSAIDVPNLGPPLGAPEQTVVQTFYIQRRQPNIVFGAYRPDEVYFPAGRLMVDTYGSVRSPILLEPGTVYSVVSHIPVTSPQALRGSPAVWPGSFLRQYTQLPADLPARVVRLAHRITDSRATTYDKVITVQRWLRAHARYTLDPAPDPPGVDAVDWFLFERRSGLCEHFASAMAVLLRSVGIPARLAVGFGPGSRDLLSGYYDVRESDAHAWVEVYYPTEGWVEYDPTNDVPAAAPGLFARFIAPEVFAAVGRFLARIVPGPVKTAARAVATSVASAVRWAVAAWPAGLAILGAVGAAFLWLIRRRRRRRRGPEPTGADAAFVSLCRTFAVRGHPRAASRTAREYVDALMTADPLARQERFNVETVVRTFERARFGDRPPEDSEVDAALTASTRIRERARVVDERLSIR